MAEDDLERRLLQEVAAAPDGRRRAALEALKRGTRDRVDEMWGGSPIRVAEARKLAEWLGYELRLVRVTPRQKAPAYAANEARGPTR